MDQDTNDTKEEVVLSEPTQIQENDVSSEPKMSKSAMKKAARRQAIQEQKKERRAREKEMRKEKKRVLHQKRLAGELDEDEKALLEQRAKKRRKLEPFGGKVVVDLGFDDKMTEKEVNSLTSQLAYTYSGNRNASFPFSLLYTSLSGRTHDRLEAMNDAAYKRWSHTEWWHEGYEKLWISTLDSDDVLSDMKEKVVYLTADSDEELAELKPEEIYIIGGIVDHNRYKDLCLNKAKEAGIRTARLPIGRYISSLPTRKVLTVNQVFEIMLKWVETKNWEEAFYSIIPKRKFQGKGKEIVENGKDADTLEENQGAEPSNSSENVAVTEAGNNEGHPEEDLSVDQGPQDGDGVGSLQSESTGV
ncbi:tRNA (guanine(9)-N(1))-methyltransferase [Marasmius crinis-equi]|uniref:tRNA (guanine(9)-N1)-methyltransferase n=1 Tax=Marasmius crinis-equi TaxID=585013 RepID=A0ABR3FYA1_9AGAR